MQSHPQKRQLVEKNADRNSYSKKSRFSENAIEMELVKANNALHALGVTILELEGEDSNRMIARRMNEFAGCHQKINEICEDIDLHIPFDVLSYLDDGKNPSEFTKDFLERTVSENQFTNGKLKTFEDFASILKAEADSVFPLKEECKVEENTFDDINVVN